MEVENSRIITSRQRPIAAVVSEGRAVVSQLVAGYNQVLVQHS
jgi:hypothetical protein